MPRPTVVAVSDSPSQDDPRELARYLPLSQRPRRDESAVTADWTAHLADTLDVIAGLLESLPPETEHAAVDPWSLPARRRGWTVGEIAGSLDYRLENSRAGRVRKALRAALSDGSSPIAASERLERAASESGPHSIAESLRNRALDARDTGTHSVNQLATVVVAVCDLSASLGVAISLAPIATGAVALARSLSAPATIRSILGGTALVASDGDWRVGTGRPVVAPAAAIVLFLYGRGPLPLDVPAAPTEG